MKNVMVWLVTALAACAPEVREGIYGCDRDADCPRRQVCDLDQLCRAERPGPSEPRAGSRACETESLDDAQNCGGCGLQCEASAGAVASCDKGSCMQHVPSVEEPSARARHGGPGGSMALNFRCTQDQIMVGAIFTVDKASSRLVKIEPRCAPFKVVKNAPGEVVVQHDDVAEPPAVPVDSELVRTVQDCMNDAAVTAVRGVDGPQTLDDGQTVTVVSQLALECSKLTFGPREREMSEPDDLLESVAAEPSFSDPCPEGQAVVGLVGASDKLIGWLQMLCARIVSYQAGSIVTDTDN